MIRKFILAIIIVFIGIGSSAQNEIPDQPFVKLKSGELYKGSSLKINEKLFNESVITVDSMDFKLKNVAFFKGTDNVLYGRIGSLTKCIHSKNNMNLYLDVSTGYYINSSHTSTSPYSSSLTSTKISRLYYNRGLDKIKVVNVKNLRNEMMDNKEAYNLITLANQKRNYANIAFSVGIVSAVASIMTSSKEGYYQSFFILSIGGIITGVVLNKQKWKMTTKALKIYCDFDTEK
jgi:hypothetical protein